jgi:hypothetical protein
MQTDPSARHSPIGLFRRVCYLARATALIGPTLASSQACQGHDSHGRVDPQTSVGAAFAEGSCAEPWLVVLATCAALGYPEAASKPARQNPEPGLLTGCWSARGRPSIPMAWVGTRANARKHTHVQSHAPARQPD